MSAAMTIPVMLTQATVRRATEEDVASIAHLINEAASLGLNLARSPAEILDKIEEFVVAEREGDIIACGAIEFLDPEMSEIRSVAVGTAARGTGIGRKVVEALVDLAATSSIVLLTRTPDFFHRCGFNAIEVKSPLGEHFLARGRDLKGRTMMELDLD